MRDTLLAATMAPSLLRSGAAAVLRSSCADAQHRHTPSVLLQASSVELAAVCYSRGEKERVEQALDGQGAGAKGAADGATFSLHRYGKRSSKDTGRRDRGRNQSVHCDRSYYSFVVL